MVEVITQLWNKVMVCMRNKRNDIAAFKNDSITVNLSNVNCVVIFLNYFF